MEKKNYKFKTNINCSGCVAAVKPALDSAAGNGNWHVDTENRDKILTVETALLSESALIELVTKAGYKIELIKS